MHVFWKLASGLALRPANLTWHGLERLDAMACQAVERCDKDVEQQTWAVPCS